RSAPIRAKTLSAAQPTKKTHAMSKPPLATTISSLLVCSLVAAPALSYAQGIESAAAREKARRYDYERRGREAIDNGDRAMKDKDYEKATAYYKQACDIIPNAPNSHAMYSAALDR